MCVSLPSIEIPDSIVRIEDYSFSSCCSLTSVTMPESVLVIGKGAFYNCGLVSVALPIQLREIHEDAFRYCRSLVSIEMPDSVTVLENGAFESCKSLKYAVISKSLKIIDRHVFYKCAHMSFVSVPKSVKRLGWESFGACYSLESIELPGLTAWDLDAFKYCCPLTIRVPASMKHVNPGRSTSGFHIEYIEEERDAAGSPCRRISGTGRTFQTRSSARPCPLHNDVDCGIRSLCIVQDLDGWNPSLRSSAGTRSGPKKEFVDPSIAVSDLETSPEKLSADMSALG